MLPSLISFQFIILSFVHMAKIFCTKCTVHAKTYILLPRKVPEYAGWVTVAWGSPWGVSSRVRFRSSAYTFRAAREE